MLFNYNILSPIPGVKRSIKRNLHTGFLQVTYETNKKSFMIEKITEGKYQVERMQDNILERKLYSNLNAVDMARYAFFE